MTYVIVHEDPRGDSEREYATLEDAKAAFSEIEPQAGHRYILVDEDDNILDIKPEIPESASFTARVRRASNQYAIHVTIPAKIRDELRLMPGDELDVTISRHRGSRERIIIRDAVSQSSPHSHSGMPMVIYRHGLHRSWSVAVIPP